VILAQSLIGLRYRGGGHVESWFLKANEPGGRRALWIRACVLSQAPAAERPGVVVPPMAEVWAVAFDREEGHVATKTTVPLEAARLSERTLDATIDGCELSLGHARGAIATGGRRLAWELSVGPERAAPIMHLPKLALYDAAVPSSKLVTPLADARASGVVRVERGEGREPERWDVRDWPSMVGHSWGRAYASLFAWVHCNAWDDAEGLTLEAVSARVRLGPVLSPMGTAVFLRYQGRRWDLNARELFGGNRGSISMRRWEATARGDGLEIHAELAAETDDFVGLHYANPSGPPSYCLNTKLARARVELRLAGRAPVVATSRAGALEIGTRDPGHGVRMHL
jgi:hypothetical protein